MESNKPATSRYSRGVALEWRPVQGHIWLMTEVHDNLDLTGKVLIAMPGMGDPRFERSVIYMCAHSEGGALGLIINKPRPDMPLTELLAQLEIPTDAVDTMAVARFGGPVEPGRGFVLHSADYTPGPGTLSVDMQFSMTATADILHAIGAGQGPARYILALGYAGWAPGQLETEIMQNGWLTADASEDLIFGSADSGKWEAALRTLGIDPLALSPAAGHA